MNLDRDAILAPLARACQSAGVQLDEDRAWADITEVVRLYNRFVERAAATPDELLPQYRKLAKHLKDASDIVQEISEHAREQTAEIEELLSMAIRRLPPRRRLTATTRIEFLLGEYHKVWWKYVGERPERKHSETTKERGDGLKDYDGAKGCFVEMVTAIANGLDLRARGNKPVTRNTVDNVFEKELRAYDRALETNNPEEREKKLLDEPFMTTREAFRHLEGN